MVGLRSAVGPRWAHRLAATLSVVLAVLGLGGCSSVTGGPTIVAAAPAPVLGIEDLDQKATLILLADRLLYERLTVERALQSGPATRRLLALTLARVGDVRGLPVLARLLSDPDARVRRAAAFALGQIPARSSKQPLLRACLDSDRETGALAVGSLARIRVPLGDVLARLRDLPAEEVEARLLPDLHRFSSSRLFADAEREAVARLGIEAGDAWLRGRAAYALSRNPRPDLRTQFVELLHDSDPWVRTLAIRGLGATGSSGELPALREALLDSDGRVVVSALQAVDRILARGQVAAPADWRSSLLSLFEDPRAAVRVVALETSARWLLDEEIGTRLAERATAGELDERRAAMGGLVQGGDPRGAGVVAAAATDADPRLRAAAGRFGGHLLSDSLLAKLESDSVPIVRQSLFEAQLAWGTDVELVLQKMMGDPDGGVRAAALRWLIDHPLLPVEALGPIIAGPGREVLELTLNAIDALVARAEEEPLERGTIVALLERLAEASDYLIRQQAAAGLGRLEQVIPEVGPVRTLRQVAIYRDVIQRTTAQRSVQVQTSRGSFVIDVDCPETPLTCLHFLELANQGFYRGLTFYRVVPGSRVEAGDPRGDGWGGPGFRIRDEVTPRRLQVGSVVMNRTTPHAAGSRFSILLEERPDLEGEYTAFGRVVAGLEVVAQIREGDIIESMREIRRVD